MERLVTVMGTKRLILGVPIIKTSKTLCFCGFSGGGGLREHAQRVVKCLSDKHIGVPMVKTSKTLSF